MFALPYVLHIVLIYFPYKGSRVTVKQEFGRGRVVVVAAFAVGEKVSVNNGSMNSARRMIVSWVLFKLIAPLDRCYFLDVLCLLCRMYCTLSLFTFLIKKTVKCEIDCFSQFFVVFCYLVGFSSISFLVAL